MAETGSLPSGRAKQRGLRRCSRRNHHRYLDENATPEWKRAYIDYRACKKQIKKISQRLANIPDPPAERIEDDGDGADEGAADGTNVHRTGSSGRHGGSGGYGGGLSLGRRLTRNNASRNNQSESESDDGDHGPARMRRTVTTGSVRSRSSAQGAPSPASALGAAGSTPPAAPMPTRSPSGIAAGFQSLRSPRGINIVTAPGGALSSSPTSGSLTPTTALTRVSMSWCGWWGCGDFWRLVV